MSCSSLNPRLSAMSELLTECQYEDMDSLERPFKPDAILPVSYASVSSKPLVSDKAAVPAKIV